MKAERRHELRENDLAHALKEARTFFENHSTRLGLAAIVVLVVVGGSFLVKRARDATLESAWRRRSELRFNDFEVGKTSLASLAAMTNEVSDDGFVMTSLMERGQQALRLSQMAPFPPDKELNRQAQSAFEQLLVRFDSNPVTFAVAHLGLATVQENNFVLDSSDAHKQRAFDHLRAVADDERLNALPLQALAMERLERLDRTLTPVVFESPPVPVEDDKPEVETKPDKTAADEGAADDQ